MSETALVPVDVQPRDVMVRSQNIASAAKEIVMRCSVNLQGKRYICAEGWQALANLSNGLVVSQVGPSSGWLPVLMASYGPSGWMQGCRRQALRSRIQMVSSKGATTVGCGCTRLADWCAAQMS